MIDERAVEIWNDELEELFLRTGHRFETEGLSAYHMFWEAVRDTDLFSVPYVEVTQVAMGIEDGFAAYDRTLAPGGQVAGE
ncbi:hypothetical protein QCN29_17785 [Streptomyces sp. HNM0663]|uniref:Uncharacterized protein n=1 Tax=Streptomyces chengmaiensis TaxID=3040919 RepID=A0ABT6HRE6_9ACTN|nr:hypothetical protein [Streptomyces chengmaiensis]MDH2390609.1 hypothetical protein [Streptomyces chengmaiensis]